jgi:hypothetical protein
MLVIGAIPLFVTLGLAFVAGAVGLGAAFTWAAVRAGRRAFGASPAPPALAGPGSAAGRPAAIADDPDAVPRRLAELEARLRAALAEARDQSRHLRGRRDRVAQKGDRPEIVARYEDDAALLDRRADGMERVMVLVWRTRSVLSLRAHLAATARLRPDLSHLPEGQVPQADLPRMADRYEAAADDVRSFVVAVEGRAAELSLVLPRPPDPARPGADDHAAIDAELRRVRETYAELQNRMDRLADTLSYLADRCTTRQVVAGAEVSLPVGPGTEALLDEVSDALDDLHELSGVGDRQLADAALHGLSEDISQLERAGLDARAAADAELEIERLLGAFPHPAVG